MPSKRRVLVFLGAVALMSPFAVQAQDSDSAPSLGDVARQARQQKQQKASDAGKNDASAASAKDAASKDTPVKNSQVKEASIKDIPAKDPPAKDAPPPKGKRVITNDEIPEHIGPARTLPKTQASGATDEPDESTGAASAEYWKGQILAAKNSITSLQGQIASLTDSIQYAGANCVSNCVQWNERQQQKQQQVETMKQQLDQAQKQLEDLQDTARKQGFGSSVYDP